MLQRDHKTSNAAKRFEQLYAMQQKTCALGKYLQKLAYTHIRVVLFIE